MLVTPLVYHSAALLRIPTQSKSYRSVGCCVSLRRAKGPTPDGPTPDRARGRPSPGPAPGAGGQAISAADLYLLVRIYS
jgi:hypothetical protein